MECKNKRYMPDPFIAFRAVNCSAETGEMETGRATIPTLSLYKGWDR